MKTYFRVDLAFEYVKHVVDWRADDRLTKLANTDYPALEKEIANRPPGIDCRVVRVAEEVVFTTRTDQ